MNHIQNKIYSDYSIESIWKKKIEKNVTVSLVFPTLNEQFTIENVIKITYDNFCQKMKILDEIIILDGGSSDKTVEICSQFDFVKIYNQHDIELSSFSGNKGGKGDALYKSIYLSNSDIIIWIDSDIKNYDEKFVIGLLGPLIVDNAYFSKGYYKRPYLTSDNQISKDKNVSGGRVTELCARPMFNLLYPELKHIIQPLGGEYGGYRTCLENLEFSSGYGVETMLLIKLFELYGSNSICQVDLGERIHRHQPLCNLTRMSFVIMQTFLKQIEQKHNINIIENTELYYLPNQQSEDNYSKVREEGTKMDKTFLKQDIEEEFKPAIIVNPEYQDKFYNNTRNISLYFIRHGETNYNINGIIQGQSESYLNIEGQNQVKYLKKFIQCNNEDIIISSDLLRCRQTCEILFGVENMSQVIYSELLRERHMGKYQGLKTNPDLSARLLSIEEIENGEHLHHFYNRIDKFLKLILDKIKVNKNIENIYIVTHSTFIIHFYKKLYGKIPDKIPDNCSICSYLSIIGEQIEKIHMTKWNIKNTQLPFNKISENVEKISTKTSISENFYT